MPLDGYSSLCDEHATRIVSRDKGNNQRHIAVNCKNSRVAQYKVDGVVITEGDRCDFLLMNEDTKIAYLIELKGQDLAWAAKKLDTTDNCLALREKGYTRQYRIVANKCKTQEIESSSFKKYRMKWKKALVYRTSKLEEDI